MALANDSPNPDLLEDLRAAIRSEAYEKALTLLPAYVRQLEQALVGDHSRREAADRLVEEANQLFRWAKRTISANRAHTQAELHRLSYVGRCQPVKERRGPTCLAEA